MVRILIAIFILLFILSCKSDPTPATPPIPTTGTPTSEVLINYLDTTSSGDNASPSFKISNSDGAGFSSGTVAKVYQGSNCDALIVSTTLSSYSPYLQFTATLNVAGTYQFSAKIKSAYSQTESLCSKPISYTYNAPAAPTSINLLSEASPSSNPNPKIKVNGIGSHLVEIYLNNSCAGNAIVTSSSSQFILPPLNLGTHSIYAKTVSSTGVKSVCSPKLFEYQSLRSFGLNLSINTNPLTLDFAYIENIEHADLDGDGNEDFVFTKSIDAKSGIYFGNGSGNFQVLNLLSFTGKGYGLRIADVDGDGKKDILMGDGDYRNIVLYRNNGGRNFTKVLLESIGYEAFDNIERIEFTDINGDGFKDIVVGAPRNGKVYSKLGNGDGTFQAAIDLMGSENISKFQLQDMNNDGNIDLFSRVSSNYKIYLNNGSGVFSLSTTVSTSIIYGQTLVEDINGDNWPDIITVDNTSIKTLLNNQSGGFNTEVSMTFAYSVYPFHPKIDDINNDGKKDLFLYDLTNKSVAIFTGNNDGTLNYPLMYPVKTQASYSIFDMNNDGKKDILGSSLIFQN